MIRIISEFFDAFDLTSEKYEIQRVKLIGDAYIAVSGLPHSYLKSKSSPQVSLDESSDEESSSEEHTANLLGRMVRDSFRFKPISLLPFDASHVLRLAYIISFPFCISSLFIFMLSYYLFSSLDPVCFRNIAVNAGYKSIFESRNSISNASRNWTWCFMLRSYGRCLSHFWDIWRWLHIQVISLFLSYAQCHFHFSQIDFAVLCWQVLVPFPFRMLYFCLVVWQYYPYILHFFRCSGWSWTSWE